MTIFNPFFKIVKKRKSMLIMYLVIFLSLSVSITKSFKTDSYTEFSPEKVDIGIIDKDQSEASAALSNYLASKHNISFISDSKNTIQDTLYYGYLDYVLVIPSGFEADLTDGKEVLMDSYDTPDSMNGFYVDMQINSLIKTLKLYMSTGFSVEDSFKKALMINDMTTKATVAAKENSLTAAPGYSYYYRYLAYVLIAMLCSVLAPILSTFRKRDLLDRIECSATPLAKRNRSLILSSVVLCLFLWAVMMILSILIYKGEMLSYATFPFYIANTLALLVLSVALSFLLSCFAATDTSMSIFSTVIPLVCSFLGGIFVPQFLFSKTMLAFCHIVPTFYYAAANDILSATTKLTSSETTQVLNNILIQLLFAGVLFGMGILATRKKSR